MHHYQNAITDTKGNALIGYFARCVDTTTTSGATLYSDESLTPIISVSGVADAAKVNSDGNVDFYLNPGTYHLDIYAADSTTFIRRIASVPMTDDSTLRTDLAASTGSSLAGFIQSGTGAVARTVQAKLRDVVSLKDFGAVGDGVANDTAAIALALAYIVSTGDPVFVPPGTYLTDPFQIAPQTRADQGFFYGLEAASTIFQRRASGAGAFVTIGSATGTLFQYNLIFSNITLNGGPNDGTFGDTCVLYDVVRSQFDNVIFTGGTAGCHSYGGIALDFNDCEFSFSQYGFKAEHFNSLAGGGYPNLIRLNNCRTVNNSLWGIWYDYGRMLMVTGGDVESNGTTLAAAQGGIYIGPNVGAEVSGTDSSNIGLIADGIWLEHNLGVADIHLNSGINLIENCNSFSDATQTTNDVRVDGGRYLLRNLNSSFTKTANLLENSGAASGNLVERVDLANLSYDATKTTVVTTAGAANFSGNVALFPAASATPGTNGQMTWQLTNNTTLVIKVKGSDGTVRSTTLTLA